MKQKKHITGKVIKKSGDKTIKVAVNIVRQHKIYARRFNNTYNYQVHDEFNEYLLGDEVKFIFCRKLSSSKSAYAIKKCKILNKYTISK